MADTLQKKTIASTAMRPLGLVFVILISAPSFVLSGRIPAIPAGHRAQYLLIRPDGGYSAGYDTGHGHTGIAEGDAVNEVRGEYVGGPLRVTYTAGVHGYIPTVEVVDNQPPVLAHPPTPAAYPRTPVVAYPQTPAAYPQTPAVLAYPILPPPPPHRPLVTHHLPPPLPIETADASVQVNADGSYSYSYRTSDHSSGASVAAQNTVNVGRGVYLATPPPPVQPTGPVTEPTEPTADTAEPRTEDIGTTPSTDEVQVTGKSDASYAFVYETPDQERAEISDSDGNVKGLFSFVAPDGVRRQVDYEAGANKGFIAKGAHLPTPPTDTNGATNAHPQLHTATNPPPQVYIATNPPPQVDYRTAAIPQASPPVPNARPPQLNTRAWNTSSWPVTVPDPLRVDSNVGDSVVRNYLPSHPVKAGYVLDNQ